MKLARKGILLFFLWAIVLAGATLPGAAGAEGEDALPPLMYFFENYCDACHPETEFIENFYSLTGRHLSEYSYSYYNVRYADNRSLFDAVAEEYGIEPENRFLPMVVVNGVVYAGNSRVEAALPMDFLENESTDSVIYYLYSPSCASCAEAEKTIDALPETLKVKRGKAEFDSAVRVIRVNIYEDISTATALFEKYRVPEDERTTPILFLREDYVHGADQIASRLPYMLPRGLAVGTQLIAPADGELQSPAFSLAGTVLAGLVAGFNPCALSMLLLFLSILMTSGEGTARYAVVYLAAKFVAYVAIGTVFLSVFSAWNPTWLPLAAKLILTAVGGALIVLNLMDAWAARREKYGQIKNQLPRGLRRYLNERIRSALTGKGAALLASVALLGVVVAASEFLCSGQLYLASLTASLSAGAAYARQLMLLLAFCLAFLLPSVVITVAVVKSRDMFAASDAIRRGMPAIKLATAAAMLLIILAAWFLI